MQTFYLPELEFISYVQARKLGESVHLTNVDGKMRWIIDLDADKFILRPIPVLTRWQHLKAVFSIDL